MRRRSAWLLAGTLVALALGASAAQAGEVVRDRTGDVRGTGLTAKAKAALDTVSVETFASADGVLVEVRLKGSLEVDIPVGDVPIRVAAGDVNGDGLPDVVVASEGTPAGEPFVVTVLTNTASGFVAGAPIDVGARPGDVKLFQRKTGAARDIVVSAPGAAQVRLFEGTGAGAFAPTPLVFQVGPGGGAIALGDVSGDGKLDVVVANSALANASLLVNQAQ